MFGTPIRTGLTFTKVLGGISKTLNIANQVIPLYREAKPMIRNAKTILSVLKDVNKPTNNPKEKNKKTLNTSNISNEKSISSPPTIKNNNLVFFL